MTLPSVTTISFFTLFLGLLHPTALQAQARDVEINIKYSANYVRCMDLSGGVTMSINDCTNKEIPRWDTRLNAAYRRIMSNANLSEKAKTQLRDAQRAWISYRLAACIADGDIAAEGGTASGLIANGCFLQMTAQRAVELEANADLNR